ncbi:phosphoesterase PHP domain-containing protein [Thermincola ferriacetica]|uniref:Phosphoesterase PHP domain-containing protein n=1 Tax=Thermincola ferriacetica TaxID=281456 RepID=A0A0L6VYG0_9FIRM|nr:PHP domain-containing protein [Thermincola ferriacetica]KNZ68290.1 phosphoesterase PHP domain-containing protein [Thermincola ferriacetica]
MNEVKWRKVDLHLHSDASYDCNLTPEALVDEVIRCGINLFSVTDHNCIDNITKIRQIVDSKNEQGIEIEFLPGIEVRTDKGGRAIHVLVIFPEYITEEVIRDKFLPDLSLTRTDIVNKGKENQPSLKDEEAYKVGLQKKYANFETVVKAAKNLGGIIIAAHPKSQNGIEQELDYTNTQNELICDLVKCMDVMEVRRQRAQQDREFYLNKNGNFITIMASVKNSDAHFIGANPADENDPRVIGKHYTWIKMDTIDFNGLTQILFEPELRVCISEKEPPINHPYIKGIKVSGGFYKELPFNFSPELNTIIGGRGSGKSVVIDLIRFVFGKYDKTDFEYMDRLYNLLRPSNIVNLDLVDANGKLISVSRTLELTKQNDKSFIDNSIPVELPFDVEIFGQGKLKEITKKAEEKLRLIDEVGGLNHILEDIETKIRELEDNALKQIEHLYDISKDIDIASNKSNIQKSIQEIETLLNEPILQEFQKFEEQKKYFDLIIKNLRSIAKKKEQFLKETSNFLKIEFPTLEDTVLQRLKGISEQIFKEIEDQEKDGLERIKQIIKEVDTFKIGDKIWLEVYRDKLEEYTKYLQEHGMENIIDETKKLKDYKDQLVEIENNVEPKIRKTVEEIKALQNQRQQLLQEYYNLNNRLSEMRINTAKRLTEETEMIEVTISQDKNFNKVRNFLIEIFTGKNVQKKQVENIINAKLTGKELAQFIKDKDLEGLTNKANITSHTAGVLFGELSGTINFDVLGLSPISDELFQLELIQADDEVAIKIFDTDEKKYKNFSRFSPGQQCSFLLSILLKASNKPLIIDQPEDELDWQYIKDFINKLQQSKCNCEGSSRQFIFVTHNQNITVLADSEKVFKVKHLPIENDEGGKRGDIEACGGVERPSVKNAILSLEGGQEAFLARGMKYGLKLSN